MVKLIVVLVLLGLSGCSQVRSLIGSPEGKVLMGLGEPECQRLAAEMKAEDKAAACTAVTACAAGLCK